jgi:hypothetical protein
MVSVEGERLQNVQLAKVFTASCKKCSKKCTLTNVLNLSPLGVSKNFSQNLMRYKKEYPHIFGICNMLLHIVKDVVKHHFIHLSCHPFILHPVIHSSRHGLFISTGRKKSGIQMRHGGEQYILVL